MADQIVDPTPVVTGSRPPKRLVRRLNPDESLRDTPEIFEPGSCELEGNIFFLFNNFRNCNGAKL
jgi:hypothetical protein